MRVLTGLIVLVCMSHCWAQLQISTEPEHGVTVQREKPWTQAGLLVKPESGISDAKIQLLKSAAAANDTDALMTLASLAASDMDAFEHVRRAAELGNHHAERHLAGMDARRRGVKGTASGR